MKIHTSLLTYDDLYEAARLAHVDMTRMDEYGSRTRARKFDILLEGSSPRRPNSGGYGAAYGTGFAATWDEWGIFMHHLFLSDPQAIMSTDESADYFVWRTANRYATLRWEDQCRNHNWEYQGLAIGGRYAVKTCKKDCGATIRYMVRDHKFADLAL